MIIIDKISTRVESFFDGLRGYFSQPQWRHFQYYVLGLIMTGWRKTVTGISRVLEVSPHRTKRNEFLTQSQWDDLAVVAYVALRQLKRLGLRAGELVYLIIDDTHTKKRGKKQEGVGKYRDTATMGYIWGHNIISAVLSYKGWTIPLRMKIHLKPEQAQKLNQAHRTGPELAAEIIRAVQIPEGVEVICLFDSAYMNKKVIRAVKEKGWGYVSNLPKNRNIRIKKRWTKVKKYSRCIPTGQYRAVRFNLKGRKKRYYAADREGYISSIGRCRVVFSKKSQKEEPLCIVTNQIRWSRKEIIRSYNLRWVIECFFKETKQYLGLGEYQTGKIEGVQKHLHMMMTAYSLLVHEEIKERDKKREKQKKDIPGFSLVKARDRLRRQLLDEALREAEESADPRQAIRDLRSRLAA